MNRQQAEHILDGYVRMKMYDEEATDALREIILDAMTEYRVVSSPSITLPGTMPPNQITTPKPYWGHTHVTCMNGDMG